jgi:SSS family solute:Na+ symporter
MSTGDALLHAAASVTVEDGVRPFRKLDDAAQRRLIQVLVVVAGVVAYAFAVSGTSSLVVLLLTAYGIIAQFAPPVLAALYWRRATTPGVLAGLVAGSAASVFFLFNAELRPWGLHEGILGLALHVPVLVGVSLLTPAQPEARIRRYLQGPEAHAGESPAPP